MTDLVLNEDSQQYKQLALDFAKNEIAPKVEHLDKTGQFPEEIYAAAWELGLLTALVPENYGGLGLSLWDACVISEELSTACSGVAAALEANIWAIAAVLSAGTTAQKELYLGRLTAECSFAGHAIEENQITYKKTTKGYVLNGQNIPSLNATKASFHILIGNDSDTNKQSAFILDAETTGLESNEFAYKLGRKCADIGTLSLSEIEVGEDKLLGKEGNWPAYAQQQFCLFAPIAAAHAVGISRAACSNAVTYSKERFAFGQPIANYQGISFMLADMAKNCQSARLLTWNAASLADRSQFDRLLAQSALSFATQSAMSAATNAVQIYGGYGYSREYPVEKLMRDAKVMQQFYSAGLQDKINVGKELVGSIA
ncbi:MAG: acyl-CoA dehydrogenase family protein [Candidatus Obscuribacterales bacterium]|nr:acyl-CoA dehydrogenase family protein [Candidatus Obscuribacterales bacterium]